MAFLIGRRKLPQSSLFVSALVILAVASGCPAPLVAQASNFKEKLTDTEQQIANEKYKECLKNPDNFFGLLKQELQSNINGERHITYCKCWIANFMKFNKDEEGRDIEGYYERIKKLNRRLPVACYKMALERHPD